MNSISEGIVTRPFKRDRCFGVEANGLAELYHCSYVPIVPVFPRIIFSNAIVRRTQNRVVE